jgi:hypothetical protein
MLFRRKVEIHAPKKARLLAINRARLAVRSNEEALRKLADTVGTVRRERQIVENNRLLQSRRSGSGLR